MDNTKTINALTKWKNVEQCNCGGKISKWNDISNNTFHVSCAKPKI